MRDGEPARSAPPNPADAFARKIGWFTLHTMIVFGVAWEWGLALSLMWGWFVAPLGVPVIGIAQAVGLILLVRMLPGPNNVFLRDGSPTTVYGVVVMLIVPLLFAGVGWIAHMVMVL